jgi:hypothetical protein
MQLAVKGRQKILADNSRAVYTLHTPPVNFGLSKGKKKG